MESLIPENYPTIRHRDFAPTRGGFYRNPFRAPPPNVLRSILGSRPYEPVDVATLRVGDEITMIGSLDIPDWSTGRITELRHLGDILFIFIDIHGRGQTRVSVWKTGYPTNPLLWFYKIRGPLTSDEAKGLSEISGKYKLPYDVVGNIKEAITGEKPVRFRPDSKTGGKTRRAKGRKYRKQVGRPSTRRVR
jgi:hypothetical protein